MIAAFLTACISGRSFGAALYPVKVRGGDEASFIPSVQGKAAKDGVLYDAVVIGGGLAGMTASLYLSDHGKKVLLLEKEAALGGLAFGGDGPKGLQYNRGAAYWTRAYEEELKILEHLGLGDYDKKHAIPEPIDSYLWKGTLYEGIWEHEALERLPAGFALFKSELLHADKAKLIPNQPLEEGNLELDSMSAVDWIRGMPAKAAARQDPESKKIHERFLADTAVGRSEPMEAVIDFLDIFCRSALGTTTHQLSAVAFANFYISEIETRYTTPVGTGLAARTLEALLRKRKGVRIVLRSPVVGITPNADGVEATYVSSGRPRSARARYAVFAAQLKFAPRVIAGLRETDSEKVAAIETLGYANFSVHAVFVKGHPYRASFDTWFRAPDYSEDDPTDVILGRWMDPRIKAFEGMRSFQRHPKDQAGVMTIYHPLKLGLVGRGYKRADAEALARGAVERMIAIFNPYLQKTHETRIEIQRVETNRWPYSIHIVRPGHFARLSKTLRRTVGRVLFANNNIGTPTFEEALFRGHCAANNILRRMDAGFTQESWSRCPAE